MAKTRKRKTKRQPPLPPTTCYVADSSAKGELMMLEFAIEQNANDLEKHLADISKRLRNCQVRLREFWQKLEECKRPT